MHEQMEFLVISVLNIFTRLFATKTKNVPFYSLSHVLSDSVINFIQVRYKNLTVFVITENFQAAINGPNMFWPNGIHNFTE